MTPSRLEEMSKSYGRATADELPRGLGLDDLYPVPPASRFKDAVGDHVSYIDAPDLAEVAESLMEEWSELEFIESLRVRYLWKDKGTSTAMGKCTKVSGFWPALVGIDIVIWLGAEDVREGFFTYRQLRALLYHEMSHIGVDEDTGKALIVPHDAEVFFGELRRYGVWSQDYSRFGQLSLDGCLAEGEGLQPQRYGACRHCGTTILLAEPCPVCEALRQQRRAEQGASAIACSRCGAVQEGVPLILVDGVCSDCRVEAVLGQEGDRDA